ncbi:NnrS family protein [Stella sp.]|uniref:NnrS family protein n=1 Tax=Stella sp. TaxID=2912054 RepID=UPI0035B27E52
MTVRPISIGGAEAALPPPILRDGFRPLFLGAAVWAAVALGLWLAALSGGPSPGGSYGALAWHTHEMVFGVGAGVVGGFLLTAVPSWTGRPKATGPLLAAIAAAWLLGRVAMLAPDTLGTGLTAVLDLAFLLILTVRTAAQVAAGRNWRNLPMVAGALVLLAGNGLVHADMAGLLPGGATAGPEIGLLTIVLLIAVIGGRIVPAFTRNWLVMTGRGEPLPVAGPRLDALVLALTVAAAALWVAGPEGPAAAAVAGLCAAAHALRLARWQGWRTTAEPLVLVLHLGYLWVAIGFALMTASLLAPGIVPRAATLHAFGAGAMATMMLAMMTRATLGHTGRALAADRATSAIYVLVTVAAVTRVGATLLPDLHQGGLVLSGLAWILAFALYAGAYGPKLWGPRVDA